MATELDQARRTPMPASLGPAELLDFFETSTIGLHAVGPDGTILWANRTDHELLGYAREEYVGRNITDFHADKADIAEILETLTRGERLVARPATLLHKDGSLRHVLIDSSAYFRDGKFGHTRCFTRDVTTLTEQTQLNDAMRRAHDELGDGIVLCDDERVHWANEAYCRLLGFTMEEVLSPAFDLAARLAPDERPAAASRGQERPAERRLLQHYEASLVRKDGALVPCEISVKTLAPGPRSKRLCIVRDVSARRAAEAELRERDAFLTRATLALLETSLDPDATMTLVARLAVERLADAAYVDVLEDEEGLRRVVIIHKDPTKQPIVDELRARLRPHPAARRAIENIPRGEVRVANDLDEAAIAERVADPDETRLAQVIGHRHALIVPLWGRAGRVASLTLTRGGGAPFRDEDVFVAKSLAARAALAYENALLHREARDAEERFRTLVTATTNMVWSTDAEGMIVDMPEWRAFTGQTVDEVKGAGWLHAVHPEDRERVTQMWTRAFAARAFYEAEYRVRGRDGRYRTFLARGVPRLGKDGHLLEYIGTWTDVTAQRQALQEAEVLRVQLVQGEKLAALGSLVSGVAHEIRTPLTYLSNNLFLVERTVRRSVAGAPAGAPDSLARLDDLLQDAHESIERIDRIVGDLRKYTRLKPTGETQPMSLDVAIRDAVDLYRATHRGEALIDERLEPTPEAALDRVQVQQVVLNLLQNAGEARPRGGRVRIRTFTTPEGAAALEVSDDGEGIPPEVLARIWDPFFTTKSEGTGLGLSIVKRIVDAHNATISCESRVGEGTTFRIGFPRSAK